MTFKEVLLLFAAATLAAQTTPKPVLGTITEFKTDSDSMEIGVKPAGGRAVFIRVGLDTEVVRVLPGAPDLTRAEPVKLTDIARGDRVMISFAEGMTEARRIVLISAADIAKRNEADRLDWKNRGISGVVVSKTANEITLEMRSFQGVRKATVTVTGKTVCRRYPPDSVRFADAVSSAIGEVSIGDQMHARGEKSAEGTVVAAEELVFGTFVTKMGRITAIDPGKNEITISDLETKRPLTIRLTADSILKAMPDFRGAMAGSQQHGLPAAPRGGNMAQILEGLRPARFEDLHLGGAVVVSSTRGGKKDAVTAIMLLANADFALLMMYPDQSGVSPGGQGAIDVNAMLAMHGGLIGPGGLSLPAIVP